MEQTIPPLTIKQLQEWAARNDAIAGWDKEKPQGEKFMEFIGLTHAELSEALEDYRNHKGFDEVWYEEQPDGNMKPCGIPTEFADVVIRIFGFCEHNGIDLQARIEEKLAFNATRGFRHGGKKI